MMLDLEDLLFEVFEELRRQRVPLGVSEYLLAIKVLREATGTGNVEGIKYLCRLLWTKSYEDLALFDAVFATKVEAPIEAARLEAQGPEVKPEPVPDLPSLPKSAPSLEQPSPSVAGNRPDSVLSPQAVPILVPQLPARSEAPSGATPRRVSGVKYRLTPRLPMERRDMAGIWRHLRRPLRAGPLEELDVQGTIDSILQNGFFLGPVLQPRRRNQAKLVLFIDQRGSMAPFSLLIDAFVESVLRGGLLGQTSIFYFHDCPEIYFYERTSFTGARSLEEVMIQYCQTNSVLIVSDAGAARGHYERERVRGTKVFLDKLSQYTYLYAWLNPMPKGRWVGNTAGEIARLLPMYQLDREGLNDVVNILRGQPFLPEFSGHG